MPDRPRQYVPQRNKLKEELKIRDIEWTPKQKEFIDLILDKKSQIIFIEGPAGSSKTYLSVYCGLQLMNLKRISDIIYVRTVVESASRSLGFLPGEFEEKFKPFSAPLEDKLSEFLSENQIRMLKNDERILAIPINYLRGANFNAKFILADESQNFNIKELITLLTRLGKFSKMVICGDKMQSDLNGKSGFYKIFDVFNNEESRQNGIYCLKFGKEDIVRNDILKFVLDKIEPILKQ